MDDRFIDRISRTLATRRLSRRRALTQGGIGLAAGATLTAGFARETIANQGATPVASEHVEFLFVQSFGSGSILPVDGGSGASTLTLNGGLGETIYFSDRPNRVVGAVPTSEFLTVFDATADDPPNAALVSGDMILVVELTSASFDQASGTLTYKATVLDENDVDMRFDHAASEVPAGDVALETCHLFIDGFDSCCDPVHRPWCC